VNWLKRHERHDLRLGDAAGQHLAGRRHGGVVGAAQARDVVQQDDDVPLVLDQSLGLFDHHLGDLDVADGRFVEGGGDHLALHRTLHVGDFFRPLVDQQDDEVAFGMVGGDRLGDVLHHDRLADPGRGDDQAALALAEGGNDVDDPARAILQRRILDLHVEPLFRVERGQIVEQHLVADVVGVFEVDCIDLHQGEIALTFARRPDAAVDGVASA
jgi:hypothetical protein